MKYVEKLLNWFNTATPIQRIVHGFYLFTGALWLTPYLMSVARHSGSFGFAWWLLPVMVSGLFVGMIGFVVMIDGWFEYRKKSE